MPQLNFSPAINALQRQVRRFDTSELIKQLAGLQLSPVNAHAIELLESACAACVATWGTERLHPTCQDLDQLTRDPAFNKGLVTQIDDPHEHLFTAFFTNQAGSHIVFPGGTTGGTRPLEAVSATLARGTDDFEPPLLDQCLDLITGSLNLSNHVAENAGLEANTLPAGWHRTSHGRPRHSPLITSVAADDLERLAKASFISTETLREILSDGELDAVQRWLTGTIPEVQAALKVRHAEPLKQTPLLALDDGWILMAPHSLLAATTRTALRLVQEGQACGTFDEHFSYVQHGLGQIVMSRLGCEPLRLSPHQHETPGTLWYSMDTDKFVSVTNLTQPSASVDTNSHVGTWHTILPEHPPVLPDTGSVAHVLHLLVVGDLGDGYRIALQKGWSPEQVLPLRSDDLELLASAYTGDSTILWRIQQSRMALHKAAKSHFFNPIDEIAFLSQFDFPRSFPFTGKVSVLVNGESGGEWRRNIEVARREHAAPWIDGRHLITVERHPHMRPTLYDLARVKWRVR